MHISFFFEKWVSRGISGTLNLMPPLTSVAQWYPSHIKPHYLIILNHRGESSFYRNYEKLSILLHDLHAYGGWIDFQLTQNECTGYYKLPSYETVLCICDRESENGKLSSEKMR